MIDLLNMTEAEARRIVREFTAAMKRPRRRLSTTHHGPGAPRRRDLPPSHALALVRHA
jgi:hypothetical protein